jgi:uncharacterized protein (DUF1778 family)
VAQKRHGGDGVVVMSEIDVLLDRRKYLLKLQLNAEQYEAFIKALEAPSAPNEKLKRLLRANPPWEAQVW